MTAQTGIRHAVPRCGPLVLHPPQQGFGRRKRCSWPRSWKKRWFTGTAPNAPWMVAWNSPSLKVLMRNAGRELQALGRTERKQKHASAGATAIISFMRNSDKSKKRISRPSQIYDLHVEDSPFYLDWGVVSQGWGLEMSSGTHVWNGAEVHG